MTCGGSGAGYASTTPASTSPPACLASNWAARLAATETIAGWTPRV